MPRLISCIVALALLAAACGSDTPEDQDSATTAAPTTEEVVTDTEDDAPEEEAVTEDDAPEEEAVTEDDASEDEETPMEDETATTDESEAVDFRDLTTPTIDDWCVHLNDLIFAEHGAIDPAQLSGGVILELADLQARMGDAQAGEQFFTMVDTVRLDPGIDPISAVNELRSAGIAAAPVLAWGISSHWGFFPDNEPEPVNATLVEAPPAPAEGTELHVAVLDTGMVQSGNDFGIEAVVAASNDDFEDDLLLEDDFDRYRGHGSFIGSLLRMQNPDVVATMYRIRGTVLTDDTAYVGHHAIEPVEGALAEHDELGPIYISDELQVFRSLYRAATSDLDFVGLNLSGGSYECDLDEVADADGEALGSLGIRAGIEFFEEKHPGATLAAAAGNDNADDVDPPSMVPASYDEVYGVIATDGADNQAGFSNDVDSSTVVQAPGVDILGVRYDATVYKWSGTSFATPIWLADHLSGDGTTAKQATLVADVEAKQTYIAVG